LTGVKRKTTKIMLLGFSKASEKGKYQLYVKWLKSADPSFEYISFSGMEVQDALPALDKCSGLVLTGGLDIHPSYYGMEAESDRCELDLPRDILEFALIEKAIFMKLPILAICRGEQILNVSQGGTLIVDIPADHGKSVIHSSDNDQLAYHSVSVDVTSNLYKIIGKNCFDIVSVHHQAVKELATCFRPTAFAGDGIIEAFEWADPEGKGYLNAVQWHPEKGDYLTRESQIIGRDFIQAAYERFG